MSDEQDYAIVIGVCPTCGTCCRLVGDGTNVEEYRPVDRIDPPRELVSMMAAQMEARFREFDGKTELGEFSNLRGFVNSMIHNAAELVRVYDEAAFGGRADSPRVLAEIRQHAIDVADYAAFIVAVTHLLEAGEFPDEKCESGCLGPVVAHDIEGVPLCLTCALAQMLERPDTEAIEA